MKDNKKQHVVGLMTDLGLTISKATTHLLILGRCVVIE